MSKSPVCSPHSPCMKVSSPFIQLCPSPLRFLVVNLPFRQQSQQPKSRTWVNVLGLSDTLRWLYPLCLKGTAGPDCPASQRNTVNRGNCTTVNNGGDSRGSSVPLPGLFHVLITLGGACLGQESHLLKKPKAPETWSWKSAAAWELGRRTEMFKLFPGAAVGPQDMEQHRWAALEASDSHIPFQRLRRLKRMLRAETEHEGLATSCVPSMGDAHPTAACRVLEGMTVTPVTAADLCLP